ncbi:MAG: hypothetical protein K2Q25_02420 [Mycobacteriaceae bacterium]|nr:hypothetical protein [Mycobacteriaceae bacterium]
MIGFPGWWAVGEGGYPNVQKLLRNLFQPLLTYVNVLSWLPKPAVYEEHLSSGGGYLRFYRTGGAINRENKRDQPRVQCAALTRSSDDSWELIEFTRQILETFGVEGGGIVPGTTQKLYCAGEVVGPQLIPELVQDDRLVPVTFELHTWKPSGLPDYRQQLGLDI